MLKNRYATWLILIIGIFYLLIVGKSLLIPLVLAVFIWYLINVLTDVFAKLPLGPRHNLPRPIAFFGALISIGIMIYFIANIITTNIVEVAAAAPAYQYNLEQMSRNFFAKLPLREPLSLPMILNSLDFGYMARIFAREITSFFSKGTIVLIYLIFLFLEQRSFGNKFLELIRDPERQHEIKMLINRIDSDIRTYLGIKTISSLITALFSYLIFSSIGLNFASFWAFLVFLLNYIPTIGSIIATIFPSLLALVQFESFGPFMIVAIGVTSVQQLIGNFLEPRFLGNRLNLSPLVILISLALWGKLWGIPGMLLCVPITAIVMIIFSHFPQTRAIAVALSRNGKIRAEAHAKEKDMIKESLIE
ncbi:MAG: AI-2E family transporter [Chitinispirillaceae bacterium]